MKATKIIQRSFSFWKTFLVKKGLYLLILLFALTSCIYEDETACPIEVRFVYDRNMEYADAFSSQVDDVTLFIFNEQGVFLKAVHEETDALHESKINLDLSPGVYQLVAWCGLSQDEDGLYIINYRLTPGVSTIEEAGFKLNCDGNSAVRHELCNLYHGIVRDFRVAPDAPSQATISLTQNVNRVKVMLQRYSATRATVSDYTVALETANYQLGYDNSVQPCEALDYRPYAVAAQTVENAADSQVRTSARDLQVVTAELATLRLTADNEARFIIGAKDGRQLLNIDLVQFIDIMRLEQYSDMPLQEYLDRENVWYVVLLVSETDGGVPVMTSLKINNWTYVFNHTDL